MTSGCLHQNCSSHHLRKLGGGGGGCVPQNRDQITNVGKIGHVGTEDTGVLGGSGNVPLQG